MRRFLISAALLSSLAIAAPASAQRYDRGYDHDRRYDDRRDDRYDDRRGGYGYRDDDRIDQQIRQIENRIHRAAERRMISQREARHLLQQARQIDRLEDRYSRNGLTQWEVRDLRQRVQHLRQQLRWERHDRDGRRW